MAYPKKTLYDILGVSREATAGEIAQAHGRRWAELERASPPNPSEQTLVHEAFEVLRDPRRREAYDASLVAAEARTAATQQDAPDIVLDAGGGPPARKPPWLAIGGSVAIVLVALFFAMRSNKPVSTDKSIAPGTAPPAAAKAEPPPPPPKRSGVEVLADASTSGGQVLSYSMSGQAIPIGLALSTEEGTMVTTCHGIPAGAKLVVRVQGQSYPADLLVTDEQLDLCKLQVANFRTPSLKVATEAPKAGDRIIAVGANQAGEMAATEGTIKQVINTTEGSVYELSMPIGEFSSGGGVFDAQGRLVGITTFQHRSGLSIAYPATRIAEMKSRQVPSAAAPAK